MNRNKNINVINNNSNELRVLYAKLEEKEKKIELLNNQLIGSIKYDDIKSDDKIIAINFTSGDSKINFPIICKSSTIFAEVERTLYKKYPDFGENDGDDILFLGNGSKIKRIKTMAENGFSGYAITMRKET